MKCLVCVPVTSSVGLAMLGWRRSGKRQTEMLRSSCSSANSTWCSDSSNSPHQHGQEHTLSPTGHLIAAICLGIIGTLGFLNNLLVLILFCRNKVLRSPINWLLINISVSDLMVCIVGTPFSFVASTQGKWLIGPSGCVWYGFVNSLFGKYHFAVLLCLACFFSASVWLIAFLEIIHSLCPFSTVPSAYFL